MISVQLLLCLIIITILGECSKEVINNNFKLLGENLQFPCSSTKNIYIKTGRYISKNIIATRMQILQDTTAFVVLPRYRSGVPFTLAKFNLSLNAKNNNNNNNKKVLLSPFPCWELHEEGNSESMQNVVDLVLDPFERLWVLDLGITNTLEHPVRRCSPKIWCFNTSTGETLKVVNLDRLVTSSSSISRLQYLLIDFSTNDGTPYAYISDAGTGAIIVYNLIKDFGQHLILPGAVSANCGQKDILYLQLARNSSGNNILYFSYLSSPKLFAINTTYLQNTVDAEIAEKSVTDVGGKPAGTQIVLLGTDNENQFFFRYKGESDIYVWNSSQTFKSDNFILVQNGCNCRMATQVVPEWKTTMMWIIESNFHDFISNTVGCFGAHVLVHPLNY